MQCKKIRVPINKIYYNPTMTGETNLQILLSSMQAELDNETYVFVTCAVDSALPKKTLLSFDETEGRTLIITQTEAEARGITYSYPCRRIILKIHSSLEAVGFLAAITAKLATAQISVNAVSAFYHDHLFVPVDKATLAMKLLREFSE